MAKAIFTERNNLSFTLVHKDNGEATMSVMWDYDGEPSGVWVEYNQETSHKEAFSMLAQGLWEAMQDPRNFRVSQEERGEMTVAPYWSGLS